MTFTYSICHPQREELEYKNEPLTRHQVLDIAKNYPWQSQMKIVEALPPEKLCYNPSLDFTCTDNKKSFCLTANYDKDKNIEFSLWYNRPKKVKILFGLLGEKEKMRVDDVWSVSFNKSMEYLEHFVNGNYKLIESLYTK
ncbi:MAG: hypothetical protein CL530_07710 [Aequorivita sp.]|nr:hypothetical protein [Aequorivita sp.]